MTQLLYTLPVFSPELQEVKEGCTYLEEEILKEGKENGEIWEKKLAAPLKILRVFFSIAVIEQLIESLSCEHLVDDVALMYNEIWRLQRKYGLSSLFVPWVCYNRIVTMIAFFFTCRLAYLEIKIKKIAHL